MGNIAKIPTLKARLRQGRHDHRGVNASSISDGAAALVMTRASSVAEKLGSQADRDAS